MEGFQISSDSGYLINGQPAPDLYVHGVTVRLRLPGGSSAVTPGDLSLQIFPTVATARSVEKEMDKGLKPQEVTWRRIDNVIYDRPPGESPAFAPIEKCIRSS